VFSEERDYMQGLKDVVSHTLENAPAGTPRETGELIKKSMRGYLYKKTKQSPMIIPIVHEL